jgi:hypothetical protein
MARVGSGARISFRLSKPGLDGSNGDAQPHARPQATPADAAIVAGRLAAKEMLALFELSWLKPNRSSYTVACNLPIQGACADAPMLALAAIDEALFEGGINGGPVAWLHDEIVLEVPIEDAERAAELLEKVMVEAFAATFPYAPLNGLVEVHTGPDWASLQA